MTPARGGSAGIATAMVLAACGGWNQQSLPAPRSSPPSPGGAVLLAGFGRRDITPPPGVGLAGNGPEGRRSRGFRVRLYVRALVLEDASGERIALAVADLPHVSPNLHRLVAERILKETGIGADRLVLGATHTHSGPGHFYAERQYNRSTSSVAGYDSAVVEFLVSRMSGAVLEAYRARRPARVAWGSAPVWGHTRNRSYDAYLLNGLGPPSGPPALPDSQRAVDPTWTMLRVDVRGTSGDTAFHPAGAFSVFAIHGTGNDPHTDLLDADIHGLVERGLERAIDSTELARRSPGATYVRGYATEAVHVFANGAEGDVSPAWPPTARCAPPKLEPSLQRAPRGPEAPWTWYDDSAKVAACLVAARGFVDSAGPRLARSADSLFVALGARGRSDVRIGRAFETLRLPSTPGLCDRPAAGTSTVGGAEDGRTRLYGYHLFGVIGLGFHEGAAYRAPHGCQAQKRVLLGSLQRRVVGAHGLPEVAQVTVVRIGGLLLGVVPAEVTTRVGSMLEDSLRAGAGGSDAVAVVGLADGFIQYVTTPAEYAAQDYEGGSTIYGPGTAAVLAGTLGRLASALGPPGAPSPPADVADVTAYPGASAEIMPRPRSRAPGFRRDTVLLSCRGDTLVARWRDLPPGTLVPADGQLLEIERDSAGRWLLAGWDDEPETEVRAIGSGGRSAWIWELRRSGTSAGRYRVRWLGRDGLPAFTREVECH